MDDGLWAFAKGRRPQRRPLKKLVKGRCAYYKGRCSQRRSLNLIKFNFNVIFVIITKTVVINPYIRSCMNPYIVTIRPNHIVNYLNSAKKNIYKTLDGTACIIFKKYCIYQIMDIPKHLNILKHFIQIFIYKNNNMYRWRLYISLRTAPRINSLLGNRVPWSLRRS